MSTKAWPRRPRIVPSRAQAISTSHAASRAWFMRHQMLAAVLGPFHRAADVARRERNQKILRIEFAARAKAAADVVLDHVDGIDGEAELFGQDAAVGEQHLGGAGQRQPPARRVPFGEQAARLHGQRGVALGAEALAPRIGRVFERRVGVAEHGAKFHGDVAAFVFEQQRLVFRRALPVRDGRQRLDVDLDRARAHPRQRRRCRPAPWPAPRRHSAPCRAP